MKKAIICGISGQDGTYLAELLLKKGYQVFGTSRDAHVNNFENLKRLNLFDSISLSTVNLIEFRSVLQSLKEIQPDEIYNLAGQTSVGLSYQLPVETMESINIGTLNLLEAIRFSGRDVKLYNAASSECFGETGEVAATELTSFCPKSPYAVAKAAAFWTVATYREAYGIFACSGILFNHESPLRHKRFVTKKIVAAACRISHGSNEKLMLGNLNIMRDWGWAPEYVEAMWLMLQKNQPDDYVIATGETNSLEKLVSQTFTNFDLDWKDHVRVVDELLRPSDISVSRANPEKAKHLLGWEAKVKMQQVIEIMSHEERVRYHKQ